MSLINLCKDVLIEILLRCQDRQDFRAMLCTCKTIYLLKPNVVILAEHTKTAYKSIDLYIEDERYYSFLNIFGNRAFEVTFYTTCISGYVYKNVAITRYNALKHFNHAKDKLPNVKMNIKNYYHNPNNDPPGSWKYDFPYYELSIINRNVPEKTPIIEFNLVHDSGRSEFADVSIIMPLFTDCYNKYCKGGYLEGPIGELLFGAFDEFLKPPQAPDSGDSEPKRPRL